MNKKTNILITGGAGYIGSILTSKLLELNYNVTVIDNLMYKQTSLLRHCSNPLFQFECIDVRDHAKIHKHITTADVIIPLAAIVGMPACKKDPNGSHAINFSAIKYITDTCSKEQHILYPNTNSGYGISIDSVTYCTEETPLTPISQYGQSKCQAESAVLEKGNNTSFRLATVFGISPRMRLDLLVNDFVYRACTDRCIVLFESHFKRNFIHINDVCNAFILGIQNRSVVDGQVFNVGLSEANLNKLELCERIQQHIPNLYINCSNFNEDPDKRNYIVSNSKIEQAFPQWLKNITSLDAGICELINGYKQIVHINTAFTNL